MTGGTSWYLSVCEIPGDHDHPGTDILIEEDAELLQVNGSLRAAEFQVWSLAHFYSVVTFYHQGSM